MNTPSRRIVIVDGYSTGRELVRELLARGTECLHLRSEAHIPAAAHGFDPTPYDAELGHVGDFGAALEALKVLRPDAIVPGSEWGVSFAERLAHALGLPTNRIVTRIARRDKFAMIKAVRQAGLRTAEQACVGTAREAHDWAEQHGTWPVVVKPTASAGSDGVSICHDHAEIDAAFRRALHRHNLIGGRNDRLLVQSFLAGPQMIVNTVSRGGKHYVTDAWDQAFAEGITLAPAAIHLLDPRAPRAAAAIAYTLKVLEALGIENGAAHTELKWTRGGPVLIETGARLMGAAMDAPSYRAAGMETQASVYATALTASDAEWDRIADSRHYTFYRHLTKLFFVFPQAGVVQNLEGLGRLRGLYSFDAHYRTLRIGDRTWRTEDSLACGGVVYLVHDLQRQIAADMGQFRSWEQAGLLYGLAEPALA